MSETGQITVTVTKVGKATITVKLEKGSTLQDAVNALQEALGTGTSLENDGVFLNGDEAAKDAELDDGDVVAAVPPVEGGC
jgi:molybdopterin converting factor small subunit